MALNFAMKNPWAAVKARWGNAMNIGNPLRAGSNTFDAYSPFGYAASNDWPEKAMLAGGTDSREIWRFDSNDKLRIGGEQLAPMMGTINFPLTTSASIVTQNFFIAPYPMKIRTIDCIFSVANGAALTATITKDPSGTAPGAGYACMTNSFNLNATAQTSQAATLPTPNPATATTTSYPAYITLATGDRLSLKLSTTITSLAGLVVSIGVEPGGKAVLAVFNMQANAGLSDTQFFLALQDMIVTGAYWCHSTKSTVASDVVQLVKDTSTNAPGAGTDLLTNNTNTGFDLTATINVPQTGTLTATAASLRLAPGNRLSVDFAGTLTALAGCIMVVVLEPVLARKFISLAVKTNAQIVDQQFFIADRDYYIEDASAVWSTAAASGNIQLTRDTGTDAPGAGTDLLSMDTNAGWQVDGTAQTPERATWVNTQFNHLKRGDRLSIDCAVGASIAGFLCTVCLRPE